MRKQVIIYGVCLALLISLLKYFEYSYFIKSFSQEVYIGLIALFFTILGIWFGLKWVKRNEGELHEQKDAAELQSSLSITNREMEVLLGINKGLSNKQIAEKLFLSESTIKTHTSNLFSKLDVNRRTQAFVKARNLGLIQ